MTRHTPPICLVVACTSSILSIKPCQERMSVLLIIVSFPASRFPGATLVAQSMRAMHLINGRYYSTSRFDVKESGEVLQTFSQRKQLQNPSFGLYHGAGFAGVSKVIDSNKKRRLSGSLRRLFIHAPIRSMHWNYIIPSMPG